MGEGAGGRGVFGLSAGARFALPSLAYPVGGTEEDPSSAAARAAAPFPHRGKAFGAAGSLRDILGLCAGAGLAPACLWHAL